MDHLKSSEMADGTGSILSSPNVQQATAMKPLDETMSDKDSKDDEALTRMIVNDELDNRLKDVLEDIAKLKEDREHVPSP